MEIFIGIIYIVGRILYEKYQEARASEYARTHARKY